LLEYVGRGGMGAVYKARQVHMGREVALKVIHRRLCQDEKQIQRFEQEARTSSKLNHPNNIRVFDYGTSEDGRLFMAMEFLKGKTLGQLISDEGTIHPARVAHIARQMFKSLAEAHELGLVHRDLKPENIFICEIFGETDFVKVLDFGIAKAIGPTEEDAKLTQTGFICGTPRYLSPEQALGQAVDGRADLYSVGVLMYEMLTGRPPFIGENPISIVMKHVHDDPPPIVGVERHGAQARQLIWLVERLLEKNPARRPAPAERIVQFLDGGIDETELMGHKSGAMSQQRGPRSLRRLNPLSSVASGPDVAGAVPRSAFRDFGSAADVTTSRRASVGRGVAADSRTPKPPPLPDDAVAGHSSALRERSVTPSLNDTTVMPESARDTSPESNIPASDETALIARPSVLQQPFDDTHPGETQMLPNPNDTRLIDQQALADAAASTPLPRARVRTSERRITATSAGHAAVGSPQAAVEPDQGGPLWAWALAGVAIAVMVLSVFTYSWTQSNSRDVQRATKPIQEVAEPEARGEVTGRALATVELDAPDETAAVEKSVIEPEPIPAPPEPVAAPTAEVGPFGVRVGTALAAVVLPALAKDEAEAKASGAEVRASRERTEQQDEEKKRARAEARAARKAAEAAALAERAEKRAAERAERKARRAAAEAERERKRAAARAEREERRAAAKAKKEADDAAAERRRKERRAQRKAEAEKKEKAKPKSKSKAKAKPKAKAKAKAEPKPKAKPKAEAKSKAEPKPKKAKPKKAKPAGDIFEPF
ncbi:MAG: serine/threonine-protein kinase, partial [Myxococcota bacterium]|nr:serine/threonine-protein kinase [Myxococcota bacterium]